MCIVLMSMLGLSASMAGRKCIIIDTKEKHIHIRQSDRPADRLSREVENQNLTIFPLDLDLHNWTTSVCAPNAVSY